MRLLHFKPSTSISIIYQELFESKDAELRIAPQVDKAVAHYISHLLTKMETQFGLAVFVSICLKTLIFEISFNCDIVLKYLWTSTALAAVACKRGREFDHFSNQAECELWYPELAIKQNVTCGTRTVNCGTQN